MTETSLVIAFVAGIVSFVAPCVLPILPGFLAYLAGASLADGTPKRSQIFINSVFFVLGFSTVFAALGVLLNTVLEAVAYDAQQWLGRIGGVIIIFFGLYLTGLIRLRFLEREHKFAVKKRFSSKYLTSFLFGAAFAAGWTPCVGAVLGAILGLAASQPGSAFSLLLAYAQGRNAGGRVHEGGEFADVGATVNAWLGGQTASRIPDVSGFVRGQGGRTDEQSDAVHTGARDR